MLSGRVNYNNQMNKGRNKRCGWWRRMNLVDGLQRTEMSENNSMCQLKMRMGGNIIVGGPWKIERKNGKVAI